MSEQDRMTQTAPISDGELEELRWAVRYYQEKDPAGWHQRIPSNMTFAKLAAYCARLDEAQRRAEVVAAGRDAWKARAERLAALLGACPLDTFWVDDIGGTPQSYHACPICDRLYPHHDEDCRVGIWLTQRAALAATDAGGATP